MLQLVPGAKVVFYRDEFQHSLVIVLLSNTSVDMLVYGNLQIVLIK